MWQTSESDADMYTHSIIQQNLLILQCSLGQKYPPLLKNQIGQPNVVLLEREILSGHRDCQILLACLLWPDRVSVQTSFRELTSS